MEAWYDGRLEEQARAYDRSQALLFVLRFSLMFGLAVAFWMSGFSRLLADGLRDWFTFPFSWPLMCVAFTALSVFGYEVILFPLSVLADYSLEKAHDRLEAEFGEWLRGFLVTLLLEIGIVTAGFTGLYVLMGLLPVFWWVAAAGAYAVLVVGLGGQGPALLLPRVRPPVQAENAPLEEELRRIGLEAGLEIESLGWWNFEHQDEIEPVVLAGTGRKRRAIFSERAWQELGLREQVFLAARQMAWHRNRAGWVVNILQVGLAGGVFFGASWLTNWAARARGLAGAADLEAFPFLVVSLFSLAAVAGVVAHAVVRRMELKADGFALRHAGGSEALRACLKNEFDHAPFAVDASAWQVLLLHRMPTAAQRLKQAGGSGA